MGSGASKAARKLTREKPSSWVARAATVEPAARPRPERPLAFESKNEAIERDAKDPRFMQKLSQLAPVRVDHRMQTVRAAHDLQDMYRSRVKSETEAVEAASAVPSAAKNRLLASSLTELLEARKSITNGAELDTLARRYHVDAATLERLARVVNTPSVDEGTVVWTTDRHGEESLTMMRKTQSQSANEPNHVVNVVHEKEPRGSWRKEKII